MADEVSPEIKTRLINLVQNYSVLWNQASPNYKTTKQTQKAVIWANMSKVLGVKDASKTWRTLRDQFVRERKKIKAPVSGMAADEELEQYSLVGHWQFYENLLFLRDTVTPRKTSGNLAVPPVVSEVASGRTQEENMVLLKDSQEDVQHEYIDELVVLVPNDVEPTNDELSPANEPRNENQESQGGARQKRSDKVLALEEKKVQLFEKKLNREAEANDADLSFLRGLLPEMKKAKRSSALKRKLTKTIDDFLTEEANEC